MKLIASRASAPGKVLIIGGYLILESPNRGLVLTTSSRFSSSLSFQVEVKFFDFVFLKMLFLLSLKVSPQSTTGSSDPEIMIRIESPQFHSTFLYRISLQEREEDGVMVVCVEGDEVRGNPFFERTLLLFALLLSSSSSGFEVIAKKMEGRCVRVVVEGDNDFYSQLDWVRFVCFLLSQFTFKEEDL